MLLNTAFEFKENYSLHAVICNNLQVPLYSNVLAPVNGTFAWPQFWEQCLVLSILHEL